MRKQAEEMGATYVDIDVDSVDFSRRPFKVVTADKEYTAGSVIISTGARSRLFGLPGEEKLISRGLHTCATCDGAFYKKKTVVVLGGGDSAMEEANYLTHHADKVTLVHRREEFRASRTMLERVHKNPKIKMILNEQVIDYLKRPNGTVKGVQTKNTKTGELSLIEADGVFVAIGHIPNTDLFKGQLKMDENGYLVTGAQAGGPADHPSSYTSVPGVFACGDVQDHTYRQAITAAGSGCMAAIDAERWLGEHG
jgi:thioredoxin reductase (NADPH)